MKIIIIFLLLLLPIASAQEIESYDLEITLIPSGLVHQKIKIRFILNQDTNNLLFATDYEIQNIKVYDTKELNFSLTDKGIVLNEDIKANEENIIFIEFDAKNLIVQSGKDFIFSYNLELPSAPKKTTLNLILPEGFVLADIEPSVSPKPSKIETNGKLINILWETNNNNEAFIAIYKRGHTSKTESLWTVFSLSSLVIILLIVGVVIFIQRKKAKEFILGTLNDEENKIIKIIRENKNITQKKICEMTGFSKSKMSKLVRRLEEKRIIKKIPFFKTNKFELPARLR